MNTIELAEFLEGHAAKATTSLTCNESKFIRAAAELRRLTGIEQAASFLIKCRGRYHAEQSTKELAVALGLSIGSPLTNSPFMVRTAPEEIWLQVSDTEHESALPFPSNHSDITWCSDSVMSSEVRYVRADLAGSSFDGATK